MKTKPIILKPQETIYIVMASMGDYVDDIHSFWTDPQKAQETLELLRHAYNDAHIIEMPTNPVVSDQRGYEISINVNNGLPVELFSAIIDPSRNETLKSHYTAEDLNDPEKVKKVLEQRPDLVNKVIIENDFPASASPANFKMNHEMYRRLKRKTFFDRRIWMWKESRYEVEPEVMASDVTAVLAYERALAYKNEICQLFRSLPPRYCQNCGKSIARNSKDVWIIGFKPAGADISEVRVLHQFTNIFEHDHLWACSENCCKKQRIILGLD